MAFSKQYISTPSGDLACGEDECQVLVFAVPGQPFSLEDIYNEITREMKTFSNPSEVLVFMEIRDNLQDDLQEALKKGYVVPC